MATAIYLIFTVALASFLSLLPDNALCKANDAMRVNGNNMLHGNEEKIYNNKRDVKERVNEKTGKTSSRVQPHQFDVDTVKVFLFKMICFYD